MLPKILIIQLKRFEMNNRLIKKENIMYYTDELNLNEYCNTNVIGNKVYELYGIVEHSGSYNGGHYLCSIKYNNKWYTINDENVYLNNDFVCKKNAYLLFYRQM